VEHAFTVKVTRRRYVTCPVMAQASREMPVCTSFIR